MSFLSKALSTASPADSLKPELLGSIRVAVVGDPSVGKTALTEVSQTGSLLLYRLIIASWSTVGFGSCSTVVADSCVLAITAHFVPVVSKLSGQKSSSSGPRTEHIMTLPWLSACPIFALCS
jgi:hypothetical protein